MLNTILPIITQYIIDTSPSHTNLVPTYINYLCILIPCILCVLGN